MDVENNWTRVACDFSSPPTSSAKWINILTQSFEIINRHLQSSFGNNFKIQQWDADSRL